MSYAWLNRAAGNVLQRNIPKNVNWGAIPTQFMNTLDDIYRMVPGASREAARNQAQRELIRRSATRPTRPALGTAGPSGQFRAPAIGSPGASRSPSVSVPPQSPVGRGPYAIDYGLRRQAMGDVRNANLVRGAANLGANGLVRGAAGFLGLTPVGVGINEAINLAFPPEAKGELPVGTRGADGKFWTGSDYGWQSGASAVKAGLLPSEVVGSTATGQAFGGGSTSQRGSQPSGGAPTAPVLPPPSSLGAGSTRPSSVGGSRQTISSVAPAQGDIQSAAPPAPALPAPVQTGPAVPGTQSGNAAAVQQAPSAIETQFQRYYQGGQMNPFFGGAPSAQAPTSAAAMEEAAMLQRAPTTMPLADYYRSQSATGRANMDQLIGLMGYTGDMEKWARANPMLAQRAYAAQFQGGGPATQGAPGAQPVLDEVLNPSSPEFRGVGGNGERLYNFAADDVDAAKIKAFQELLSKQRQ